MKKRFFSGHSVPIVLLGMASHAFAQQATVSLDSGNRASVDISLTTSGGVQPAGLQWTMNYPISDIATVNVVAGASAGAAGKTVTCNSSSGRTICIVFGMNRAILSDGIVATANFGI